MMLYIILLLLMILIFPPLLAPVAMFLLFFLLFIPFKFTVDSIFNLFFVPGQIYKIATNKKLRRNHALEHATVNVLEDEYGYKNLAGYADNNGFYILGVQNIYHVLDAAKKGLFLMKRGRKGLAIHGRCGTSMTAANLISAVIFLLLLFVTGHFSLLNVVIALAAANIFGPVLGRLIQKYFTTSPDVSEMEIEDAYFEQEVSWNRPAKIYVVTEEIPYLNQLKIEQ